MYNGVSVKPENNKLFGLLMFPEFYFGPWDSPRVTSNCLWELEVTYLLNVEHSDTLHDIFAYNLATVYFENASVMTRKFSLSSLLGSISVNLR